MGLDVLPTHDGEVRALVSIGSWLFLLDAGYEVRLHHHYPIEPVDPSLISNRFRGKALAEGPSRGDPAGRHARKVTWTVGALTWTASRT